MLVSIHQLMNNASAGGYGVGYFEAWNLESMLAVLDSAKETKSPIIIGFNGDFVMNPDRVDEMPVEVLTAMAKAAAEATAVPVGLLLNETGDYSKIVKCLPLGFTGVMPRSPGVEDKTYRDAVADVVKQAHTKGIWVEGELGILPTSIDGTTGQVDEGTLTDPEEAAEFVRITQIDALAISVGNIHHLVEEIQGIDLDLVERIHQQVKVPLVIHGGSGLDKNQIQDMVRAGMAKLNVGSCFKEAFMDGMRMALQYKGEHLDPHMLLGTGGKYDVMTTGRIKMKEKAIEFLDRLGCGGKA